jgi:hypothetical protein
MSTWNLRFSLLIYLSISRIRGSTERYADLVYVVVKRTLHKILYIDDKLVARWSTYVTSMARPCHSSGGWSLAPHRSGSGSDPGHVVGFLNELAVKTFFFFRVLRFPLPVHITPTDPYSSSSGARKIGTIVASVQSGHSFTLPQEKRNIYKYAFFIITAVNISNPTYEILRIWSSHSGGYEEFYFLVYNTV